MVPPELRQASLCFHAARNRSGLDCVSRGSGKPGGGDSGHESFPVQKARAPGAPAIPMTDSPTPDGQAPTAEDHALDEVRLRQQAIGVKLRQLFDQVVNEPVPEDFLEILRRADQTSKGGA